MIRTKAAEEKAECGWNKAIAKARPPSSKKVVRVPYPEAVKEAITAWDEAMGNRDNDPIS